MLLNVTDLGSYLYCARKLFLNKVLFLREPLNRAMFNGNVHHDFFNDIIKSEKGVILKIKKSDSFDDIKCIYKQDYLDILKKIITINLGSLKQFGIKPSEVFEENWFPIIEEIEKRSMIVYDTKQRTGLFGFELWKAVFPKIKTEISIENSDLQLKGIIDRIEYYKEGIIPFEIKTGSCPKEGVWPNHKIQLGAYILLLKYSGEKIKKGFLRYSDVNVDREIVLNPFLELEIKEIIARICEIIEKKEIPKHCDNKNKCEQCALKDKCYDNDFIKRAVEEVKNKEAS